jgi:excisionase family DNA binding protein
MDKPIHTSEKELRKIVREELERALKSTNGNQDIYISAKEAAIAVGLKQEYIYQLVFKKEIPFHKKGRSVLFKRNELEEWDQKRKTSE